MRYRRDQPCSGAWHHLQAVWREQHRPEEWQAPRQKDPNSSQERRGLQEPERRQVLRKDHCSWLERQQVLLERRLARRKDQNPSQVLEREPLVLPALQGREQRHRSSVLRRSWRSAQRRRPRDLPGGCARLQPGCL